MSWSEVIAKAQADDGKAWRVISPNGESVIARGPRSRARSKGALLLGCEMFATQIRRLPEHDHVPRYRVVLSVAVIDKTGTVIFAGGSELPEPVAGLKAAKAASANALQWIERAVLKLTAKTPVGL